MAFGRKLPITAENGGNLNVNLLMLQPFSQAISPIYTYYL